MVLKYIQKRSSTLLKYGILTGYITVFLIPFPRSWVLYAMGIFLIFSMLSWIADFRINLAYLVNKWYFFVPFVLFFFLHLAYSFIGGFEWIYVEKRLMFLLIPLIGISIISSEQFASRRIVFMKAFIIGLLSASILLLIRACFIKLDILQEKAIPVNSLTSETGRFFPRVLSFFQHPSYFSMELNFGIMILILYGKELAISKSVKALIIIIFTCMIFLLSSRAGLLSLVISSAFILIILIRRLRLRKLYYVILSSALVFILALALLFNPKVSDSLRNLKNKVISGESVRLIDMEPRTRVWYTSVKLIKEYPLFGVGIREIDNKQVQEYRRNNFYAEAFFSLNAHNQFIETQLTTGVTGTVLLLWMLFAPLFRKKSILNTDLFFSFLIIVIIQFMFESMLVRQWGIMFFVLFSCFQVYLPEKRETD
jgi:O-antigen ligase